MPSDKFVALLIYAFVSSVTPGPNNLMLLASGVNFGFRRTIPHMLGIGVGFFSLLLSVGWGLGALLVAVPSLHLVLKVLGAAYLLFLAWKIGSARSMGGKQGDRAKPMTFAQAAAFQVVNPKAWVMAVSSMAVYTDPAAPFFSAFLVAAAFALVNFPSVSVWAGFGMALRGFLADPVRLRWFNVSMGLLLAATLILLLD